VVLFDDLETSTTARRRTGGDARIRGKEQPAGSPRLVTVAAQNRPSRQRLAFGSSPTALRPEAASGSTDASHSLRSRPEGLKRERFSGSRPLPEGVDDLPPFTRTHEVQVLDVHVGADGHVRDLAVDVVDFDFEPPIR
jgi:hypothetical protein